MEQNRQFLSMVRGNTPTGIMAMRLRRTADAVRSHAEDLGVSLKPANRPPYGTLQ